MQHYEQLRQQVKLHSGDAIDLKAYEPSMRQLIDRYIRAEESVTVSAFEDLSLVQLVARQGASAVDELPAALRRGQAAAETIENNVRRAIVNLSPLNPKYYDRMSELLDALIEQRRQDALDYKEYLAALADVARQVQTGPAAGAYPTALVRPAQRALYDNLGGDEALALKVDATVRENLQDGWRDNIMKTRRIERAIRAVLGEGDERVSSTVELVKRQDDY